MLSVCPSTEPSMVGNASSMDVLLSGYAHGSATSSGGSNNRQASTLNGLLNQPRLLWHVQNREGYNPLKLYHPYDVEFLWDDRCVVVEGFYPYSRIQILDQSGASIRSIAQGDILPYGITIDAEGYLAITDHKDRTVKFYTPDGEIGLSWQPNMFDWPDGISTTTGGHYVVTDWTRGVISMHDIDGVKVREFPSVDPNGAQYSCPAYVKVDTHHRIVVTDAYDHTVKIFDQNGHFLQKFGQSLGGSQEDVIKDPRGITTDTHGNIIVADWGANRVSMYSSDGRLIRHLLTSESNDVKYPWGVAFSNGQLLMSEQKLDKTPGLKLYQCYS